MELLDGARHVVIPAPDDESRESGHAGDEMRLLVTPTRHGIVRHGRSLRVATRRLCGRCFLPAVRAAWAYHGVMSTGLLGRSAREMASWSPVERDAVLYAASALFAIGTAQFASISLYQQWGRLAVGPYAAGAVASAFAARRARRRAERDAATAGATGASRRVDSTDAGGWHWTTPRAVIFLVVLLGATLMPLSLEVLWRTDSGGTANVQPETSVIERSGKAFVDGKDPYTFIKPHQHVTAPPGEPAYDVYNPYLPLMSLFGIPRSTDAPPRLTDARVAFSVFTMVVVVLAMALCRGPTGPRVLALQSMTVLPTAALPLATGGDDIPVAALLLLGLVLLQRRRPLWAGVALGVAASMKITAWPLAALAFLVARDRNGHRGRRPSLAVILGIVGVMIPAVLPTAAENLSAFIENVVRFPLGLAGVQSPAASPLIGHLVVSLFPGIHRALHGDGGGGRGPGAHLRPGPAAAQDAGGAVTTGRVDHGGGDPAGPGHTGGVPPLSGGLLRVGVAPARRGERRPRTRRARPGAPARPRGGARDRRDRPDRREK